MKITVPREENKKSRRCGGAFPVSVQTCGDRPESAAYKVDRMSQRLFFFCVLIVPHVCTIVPLKRTARVSSYYTQRFSDEEKGRV